MNEHVHPIFRQILNSVSKAGRVERNYSIHDPCRELASDFRKATKEGRRHYHGRQPCSDPSCDCGDELRDRVDRSIVDHDTDRGVPDSKPLLEGYQR